MNARLRELFTVIRETLEDLDLLNRLHAGVVLTGGGAAMRDLDALVSRELGMGARIGRPIHVDGLDGEEFPAAETAVPQEIPPLTEIPGIEVVSPAYPQEAPAPAADTPRFRLTGSQPFGDRILLVFTDTKTGVQYVTNDDLCGFSPLLDAEGRPLTN